LNRFGTRISRFVEFLNKQNNNENEYEIKQRRKLEISIGFN